MKKRSKTILLLFLGSVLLLSSCFPAWRPGEETISARREEPTSIREEVTTPGQENPPEPPNPYEMRLVDKITLENLPKSEKTKELKNMMFRSNPNYIASLTRSPAEMSAILKVYPYSGVLYLCRLSHYQEDSPIQYMQKIDDTHLFIVYGFTLTPWRFPDEEPHDMYLYIVFEKADDGDWNQKAEYYLCTKTLFSKDFDGLTAGESTAADAEKIESSIRYDWYVHTPIVYDKYDTERIFSSWILLRDGVMELKFRADLTGKQKDERVDISEYQLISKIFHPNGSADERFSILRSKVPVELPEGIPGREK